MTTEAAAIAAVLEALMPTPLGALCVWGDWFGKPLDNIHTLVEARSEGDELILGFDQHEILRVVAPAKWTVDAGARGREPTLIIRRAQLVEWGWYSYGRPELPENWFVVRRWLEAGEIRASSTANWYSPIFAPSIEEPAVIFA